MSVTDGSLANKSARLSQYVQELRGIVTKAVEQHTAIHIVEEEVLRTLLEMALATLQMLTEQLGTGDVGEVVEQDGRTLKRIEAAAISPVVNTGVMPQSPR